MWRTSVPKICSTSATRGGPNLLRIIFPVRHLVSHFPPPMLSTVVCFLRLAPLFLACPPHTSSYLDNCAIFSSSALLFLSSSCFFKLQFYPILSLHFYFSFFLTSSSASFFLWYITIYFSARSLFLSVIRYLKTVSLRFFL